MRVTVALGAGLLLVAFAAACGGGGDNPRRYDGEAASAVAQFFTQELEGGRLPEGQDATSVGTQQIKALDNGTSQARVCVEFVYTKATPPFDKRVRVYIATLSNKVWSVDAVKPDGTCDDVV